MVTAQTAAVLYDTSLRAIYRLVEEGKIHFIETDSKVIFVCPNSAHSILPIDLDWADFKRFQAKQIKNHKIWEGNGDNYE